MVRSVNTKPARQPRPATAEAKFDLPLVTAPMEAQLVPSLPEDAGWQFEPKWDGFRCLAYKRGDEVELRAKSGKPLGRYFPEIVSLFRDVAVDRFVIDGELVTEIDGRLAFDALQMRLHPAESRIRKLSLGTPARFVAFDMLVSPGGTQILDQPLSKRRAALAAFMRKAAVPQRLILSPRTVKRTEAEEWLEASGHGDTDGVVAKRLDGPYAPGKRSMIKVKRLRTADCVVGGFRWASKAKEVGSLLLGLYDADGKLDYIGFTSAISNAERPALTRRLTPLIEPPGFTGKAPGAPSRWSTARSTAWEPLRPELVVEVRYDLVTAGRLRHGADLVRWRPDKAPRQCTFEQIAS